MPCESPHDAKALIERSVNERTVIACEVVRVEDGDALPADMPRPIFNFDPRYDGKGHWIALVVDSFDPAINKRGLIRSSRIYGVAKGTGQVVVFGSTGDEG